MVDFGTGERKHAVYRIPGGSEEPRKLVGIGDTNSKKMPYVRKEDEIAVSKHWDELFEKNKKRRGGSQGRVDETKLATPLEKTDAEKKVRSRYPEVRGLRYLPSSRTYLARDPSAAGCIARLATYRLLFGTRRKPAPFCRGVKIAGEEEQQVTD